MPPLPDIESFSRHRIQKTASLNEDPESLTVARIKLQKKILEWKSCFYMRFPHLDHTIADPMPPEMEVLMLPSSLNEHMLRALNLQALVNVELILRKGQAHDALDKLRSSIRVWTLNFEFKIKEVRGQEQNTRAQRLLNSIREKIDAVADTYRRARAALVRLGMPEDDVVFRPLLDNELYMKNTGKPAQLGDNRREDPWFWYTGRPGDSTSLRQDPEWAIESKLHNGLCCALLMLMCEQWIALNGSGTRRLVIELGKRKKFWNVSLNVRSVLFPGWPRHGKH